MRLHIKNQKRFVFMVVACCVALGLVIWAIAAMVSAASARSAQKKEAAAQQSQAEQADKALLTVVNKDHPLAASYEPEDLTALSAKSADGVRLRAQAAHEMDKMLAAMDKAGVPVTVLDGYRSYDDQKSLYDSSDADSPEHIPAGQSEHQTGLAVDVSSPEIDDALSADFASTEAGKWLAAHASEYGFITRYPKNKTDITGEPYMPWHLRYVGKENAQRMATQGRTLEEETGTAASDGKQSQDTTDSAAKTDSSEKTDGAKKSQ